MDEQREIEGISRAFQSEKERQRFLDFRIGLALLGEAGRRQYLEYLRVQRMSAEQQRGEPRAS